MYSGWVGFGAELTRMLGVEERERRWLYWAKYLGILVVAKERRSACCEWSGVMGDRVASARHQGMNKDVRGEIEREGDDERGPWTRRLPGRR